MTDANDLTQRLIEAASQTVFEVHPEVYPGAVSTLLSEAAAEITALRSALADAQADVTRIAQARIGRCQQHTPPTVTTAAFLDSLLACPECWKQCAVTAESRAEALQAEVTRLEARATLILGNATTEIEAVTARADAAERALRSDGFRLTEKQARTVVRELFENKHKDHACRHCVPDPMLTHGETASTFVCVRHHLEAALASPPVPTNLQGEAGLQGAPKATGTKVRQASHLSTASPVAPTSGWRTFDTAPENGTLVLVYRHDAGVFTASYQPSHEPGDTVERTGEECWFSEGGDDLTGDLPTHWQPLPVAPVAPTEGK